MAVQVFIDKGVIDVPVTRRNFGNPTMIEQSLVTMGFFDGNFW
jgi:hypothetical protein